MVHYKVWYALSAFFFTLLGVVLVLELLGVIHDLGVAAGFVSLGLGLVTYFQGAAKEGVSQLRGDLDELRTGQHAMLTKQDAMLGKQDAMLRKQDASIHLAEEQLDRHERQLQVLQDIRGLLGGRASSG